MDQLQAIRESVTDAIRYWELRRIAYNAVLVAVVLIYFGTNYPSSKAALSVNGALGVFELAVLANVAYCASYVADVFAQLSGYRGIWRKSRWILFTIGLLFAGILTRYFAIAIFQFGAD